MLKDGWNVVGAVTQPDRPSGRGRKVSAPPVSQVAQAHGILVLQPKKIRDGVFLEDLADLRPDMMVVAAYGRILPRDVLFLPPLGCYNVHASLLPAYRGPAPVRWAIINGEETTGITIFRMDEGMDTGDLLLAESLAIGPNETAGMLTERLAGLAARIITPALSDIVEGRARFVPQEHDKATVVPILKKGDGRIIRSNGDGTLPVPGWTDEYEWTGYIPFEELPYTVNPEEGYIVTANNQVPPFDYPHLITHDWDYGFRAQRIVDMIQNGPDKIDIAYIQSMQGDGFDANGPTYVPLLSGLSYEAPTQNEAIAMDLLSKWDYQDQADSAGAAVFNAFWRNLIKNTFNDELPERYQADGGSRWNEIMRHLEADSTWWDDVSTKELVETAWIKSSTCSGRILRASGCAGCTASSHYNEWMRSPGTCFLQF